MEADTTAKLLKRIEEIVRGLAYDYARFDIFDFIKWVEVAYQTKIVLLPFRFPVGVSGGWLRSPYFHLVFFDADALPLQQNHSILHEIAHILLVHSASVISVTKAVEIVEAVLADRNAPLDFIVPYLTKRSLDLEERYEIEAEILALVVQAEAKTAKVASTIGYGSSNTELQALLRGIGAVTDSTHSDF